MNIKIALTRVIFVIFLSSNCIAMSISNFLACKTIKKTISECYSDRDSLIFMQNLKHLGNIVTFYRTLNNRTLKIQCHSHLGIDLNQLPKVSFEEVKTIELHKCSLEDENVLTTIKSSFAIKSVENLIIHLTKDKSESALTHHHFKGLKETKNLEIIASRSIKFDKNVFTNFLNLKTLKLSMHDIIILPFDVFKPLWKLETLDFSSSSGRMKNETKTLNFTLNSCINLKHFRLSRVRWPIHVRELLTYNRPLKTVKINGNEIKSLNQNVFLGSTEIEEISLEGNSIQSMPEAIFVSQSDLIKLDLSYNLISTLHDNIFLNNSDLESINLSNNKLNFTSRYKKKII